MTNPTNAAAALTNPSDSKPHSRPDCFSLAPTRPVNELGDEYDGICLSHGVNVIGLRGLGDAQAPRVLACGPTPADYENADKHATWIWSLRCLAFA